MRSGYRYCYCQQHHFHLLFFKHSHHDCVLFVFFSCCKSTFFCTGVSNWLDLWWSWSTACLLKTLSGPKMSFPFFLSSHFLCIRFMSIFFIFVMGFSQGYYVLFQVKKKSIYISSLYLFKRRHCLNNYSELRRGCGGRWRPPNAKSSRVYPWDFLDVPGWIFFFHNLMFVHECRPFFYHKYCSGDVGFIWEGVPNTNHELIGRKTVDNETHNRNIQNVVNLW